MCGRVVCGSLCVQACCVSVFKSVVCVCGSLCVQVRERDVNDKLRVKELCVQVCVKELCVCCVSKRCVWKCVCVQVCV